MAGHAEIDKADRPVVHDKHVPGVRVGVERADPEVLGHETLAEYLGQPLPVVAPAVDLLDVTDRDALDPLEGQDGGGGQLPEHRGPANPVDALQYLLEPGGVGGLDCEVELVANDPFKFSDDRRGAKFRKMSVAELVCKPLQNGQVRVDGRLYAGPAHFHHHVGTVLEGGPVDLCDRPTADWLVFKGGKDVRDEHLQLGLDDAARDDWVERLYAVAKLSECICERRTDEVRPGRQDLAEFDERRAKLLKHVYQPLFGRQRLVGRGDPAREQTLGEGDVFLEV